jgi:branched-chain amino acid transport system permease protein
MFFVGIGFLNGLSFGILLFLIGAGLSVIWGLMGIANLAHGALYMVGGYIGWTIAVHLGMNYWLAVLAGGICAGFLGLAIERSVLRFLYKQLNEQVLSTIGILLMISNLTLWIWGGEGRPPFTANYLATSVHILGIGYPLHRIVTIFLGLIIFIILWWLQDKTRFGAMVRAGMDNKETASVLGINLGRLNSAVFFLGAFLSGIGGVLGAQIMGLNTEMGFNILLFAMVVVIVGGLGSVQGAFIGAIVIGLIDAFGRALIPGIGMYLMYLLMVIILVFKPEGLLSRKA